MSKLIEYIKLLPKGIAHLPQIIEGFTNQVKMELGALPAHDVEVIVGRRLICSQCPFNSINAQAAGWYATERTDPHCTMCSCPIATKTASLESNCGIEQYNKQNPSTPLPLKWAKVK